MSKNKRGKYDKTISAKYQRSNYFGNSKLLYHGNRYDEYQHVDLWRVVLGKCFDDFPDYILHRVYTRFLFCWTICHARVCAAVYDFPACGVDGGNTYIPCADFGIWICADGYAICDRVATKLFNCIVHPGFPCDAVRNVCVGTVSCANVKQKINRGRKFLRPFFLGNHTWGKWAWAVI